MAIDLKKGINELKHHLEMPDAAKIGGEAGQGIQTIGDALGRVFVRAAGASGF